MEGVAGDAITDTRSVGLTLYSPRSPRRGRCDVMADTELSFELAWLPGTSDDVRSSVTFAALTITAGSDQIPVTEVDDAIAQTVRRDIRVPILPLAQWLVVNWWRLRWEPRTETSQSSLQTRTWLRAHSMSSVSTDVPWPALTFTSDGAFVQLKARAERISDVAAVRYLRDIELSISAAHFERAVDGLLAKLDARIAACLPGDRDFADLLAELHEERSDPKLARACKLQALAGFDPGVAPQEWLRNAASLAEEAGGSTGDEVVAATPMLQGGIIDARKAIEAMKSDPELHNEALQNDWPLAVDFKALPTRIINISQDITSIFGNEIVLAECAAWKSFIRCLSAQGISFAKFSKLSDIVQFDVVWDHAHGG